MVSYSFDDPARPEAQAKAAIQAVAPKSPEWWITWHRDLGRSPCSALCDGRRSDVLEAAGAT
jgi:hypothetical protein